MDFHPNPARMFAVVLVVLAAWIVHGFVEAMLAASVTAIASWPIYAWYRARLPGWLAKQAASVLFTFAITVFVLAPMVFACAALLSQTNLLLHDLAAVDSHGSVIPEWLNRLAVARSWLDARAQQPAEPGSALQMLTQHADSNALLAWARSLGEFTLRHLMLVAFTILLLAFLYQEGEMLTREITGALRQAIGARVERYMEVAARAVRSSVNSMIVVGLFDGLAAALAYAAAGAPRPLLWAAITGALAAVPFLGYVAVVALAMQLAVHGEPATALLASLLGCSVLLLGDKLVRPLVARGGMRLPFVWVLIGSIGGFGALGLSGLVLGPVVLALIGEVWVQRYARHGDHPSRGASG